MAVIYECDEIGASGACKPESTMVDVWTRSSLPLTPRQRRTLMPVAQRLCFNVGDFRLVGQDSKLGIRGCMVFWGEVVGGRLNLGLEGSGWASM
jgi:hypothetical protein